MPAPARPSAPGPSSRGGRAGKAAAQPRDAESTAGAPPRDAGATREPLDARAAPPREFIARMRARGTCFPDGVRGCYLPSYYHGNTTGSYYTDAEDGRDAGAGRRARLDETKSKDEAALARLNGWDELAIGEVDADYALYRGHRVLGSSFPYVRFKPKIARARAEACAAYAAAADEVAGAEPEAWAALTSDARYASTGRRKGAELSLIHI